METILIKLSSLFLWPLDFFLWFLDCEAVGFFQWSFRVFFHNLQTEWFQRTIYDMVHHDDVEKIREQLSTSESQNTGRILDLKSKDL